MIIDIHTHHPAPRPEAVISIDPADFSPMEGQCYSVGIHPWRIATAPADAGERLREAAAHPQVVAIGETGFDMQHEGSAPMFMQLQMFRLHVELSESLRKPLIIHDVKMHDVILELHKEFNPKQPWVIHGFRYKPSVMQMLLRDGIYFSFGEKFNADTLRQTPRERILAETDESSLPIESIIAAMSHSVGMDLAPVIRDNVSRILPSV